ncbi:hypothetical protein AB0M12_34240 [Nocardia vinacea]|uniref:hypothetical protein n=1 Tax=Nocardia vinacea TaxID=96468 RepID=UPI00343BE4D0
MMVAAKSVSYVPSPGRPEKPQGQTSAIFLDLSQDEAARIWRAAAELDAVRLPEDHFGWDWFPDNMTAVPKRGIHPVVFGTTMSLLDDLADRLELALSVIREHRPLVTVETTITVACWCELDHGVHEVRGRALSSNSVTSTSLPAS